MTLASSFAGSSGGSADVPLGRRPRRATARVLTTHNRRQRIVFRLLRLLILSLLVPLPWLFISRVIDAEFATENLGTGHVVHC